MKKNDWADGLAEKMLQTLDENANLEYFEMLQKNTRTEIIGDTVHLEESLINYNITNEESVGSFFFDHIKSFERDLTIPYHERQIAAHYYQLLGAATQGRISEIERNYTFLVEIKRELRPHLEELKPVLYSLATVAKEICTKKIQGLNSEQTVGQYQDQKCSESEAFMKKFYKLKNIYINYFHFSKYK